MQPTLLQQQGSFTKRLCSSAQQQRTRAVGSRRLCVAAQLAEGARIKVKSPIKIFHVPKYKEGLELQGMEGTVVQPNVCDYKHHDGKKHSLSATLPVKVQFMVAPPDGGKELKVLAHLAEDEIEAVA